MLTNFTFDELEIGQTASYEKTLTEREIILFAAASGDTNPIHMDEEYANGTPFGGRIAHGIWTASLISAAIANVMPGPGSIYLGQTLKFSRPVKIGDTITIQLEVTEKNEKRKRVSIQCSGSNQDGKQIISGVAEVQAPTEKLSLDTPVLPSIDIADS
ncbi:MAG: MaoC family dehydratase N-terminal domain-containing protein [Pseudomonadales bacterium]|nr:MaoC family dehydratase N-terminal domain-containing protein [Pseudomonadales bacterium]